MSYTNKDCEDLINYIIINNPNSISLKKFFILYSERFLNLCDEEFLDKILFIFDKENTNKFIIPHNVLYDYGICKCDSSHIYNKLYNLDLIENIDYEVKKEKLERTYKNVYMLTPNSFILFLISSTKHKNQKNDISIYKKYFIDLITCFNYYSIYQNRLLTSYCNVLKEDLDINNELFNSLLNKFKSGLNNISGLYLIDIGSVNDLRDRMNICSKLYPDGKARVKKIGKSKDIIRRFKEHKLLNNYGKYNELKLEWFCSLQNEDLTKAENELINYCKEYKFNFQDEKRHDELIIINKNDKKKLEEYYNNIKDTFSNDIKELKIKYMSSTQNSKIEILELKLEIEKLKRENDNLKFLNK